MCYFRQKTAYEVRISDWSSDVCSSVLDPRKDSTYPGGSGSHRALNESTYEWSDNPALHALTWALGRWENGKRPVGIGAPVANIRVSDFVEAANIADANGWTMGGVERWEEQKSELQSLMRITYAVLR